MDLSRPASTQDVAELLQRARQQRQEGELEAAEVGFQQVLLARPHLLAVECELARLRLRRGDAEAVVRQVRQRQAYGSQNSASGDWQELEGLLLDALLELKRWAEAEPLLRGRLAKGLATPHHCVALARALAGDGGAEEALTLLRQALEVDPTALEAQLELARRLRALGRWPAALDAYGRALTLAPEQEALHAERKQAQCEALWQKGEDALAQEDWRGAERAFRALWDLDPDHALAPQRLELVQRLSPAGLALEATAGLQDPEDWRQEARQRLAQFSRLLDRLERAPEPENGG